MDPTHSVDGQPRRRGAVVGLVVLAAMVARASPALAEGPGLLGKASLGIARRPDLLRAAWFASDERFVIASSSSGGDGRLVVLDAQKSPATALWSLANNAGTHVHVDALRAVTRSDRELELRDPRTGAVRSKVPAVVDADRSEMVVLPKRGLVAYTVNDGKRLAVVLARLDDLSRAKRLSISDLTRLAASPDERWLLLYGSVGEGSSRLQLVDVNTLTVKSSAKEELATSAPPVAFAPDGKAVLVANESSVWLFDVPLLKKRWMVEGTFERAEFERDRIIFPDQLLVRSRRTGKEVDGLSGPACSPEHGLSADGARVARVDGAVVRVEPRAKVCPR